MRPPHRFLRIHELAGPSHARLAMALLLFCAAASMIAPRPRADEPQPSTFATGRIYASISRRPPGERTTTQIVAINPDTGAFEPVTASGNSVRVSPNRRAIAYWTTHQASCDAMVRTIDDDLKGQRIWTGEGTAGVCWTQDGKHVIVTQAVRADNRWKFTNWLVEPETAEASQLELPDTEGIEDCAHHSDLLISWSFRHKKRIELFTLRPDGSDAVNLTGKGQYDYQGRFSSDDTKIGFLRRQGGKLSVCTADVDGKNVRIAFTEHGLVNPKYVTWSPDDKQLAFVLFDWALDEQGRKVFRDSEANFRLGITNADGSGFRELPLLGDITFMSGDIDWR